ncbi:MAG: winged helix-turn-helix domain-containing protein, partial [Chloroflexota bacterium]
DLVIDREAYTVNRDGENIQLTLTEFNILSTLASQPGRVLSRLQLLEATQDGTVYDGYERTVDTHIKNLRSKLEPDPKNPRYIETVFGVGYKFGKG